MLTVRRRHLPAALLVAAALLVPAATAQAKGLASLKVCGPEHCVDRTDVALHDTAYPEQLISGGLPVAEGAITREPYVLLRIGIGEPETKEVFGHMSVTFLPRSGYALSDNAGWMRIEGDALKAYRRVARGIPRFPASQLRFADGRAVPEAQAPVAASTPAPPAKLPVKAVATADDDATLWPWLTGAGVALVAALGFVALRRRRGMGTAGGPAV